MYPRVSLYSRSRETALGNTSHSTTLTVQVCWRPPAHACFKHVASDSITLDWEGRQDDALQWLCRNAIGPQFYYDTTVLWQKKCESKDSSPWPNGVLSPPLAWGIGLTEAPPGHVVKKTPGGGVEMKYDPQMRAAIEARARARRSQEEEERKVEELFEQTVTVT